VNAGPGRTGAITVYRGQVPDAAIIASFEDEDPPPGESPWVDGLGPTRQVTVVDPDPGWPRVFAALAGVVRGALGPRALQLEHMGSTSVPGLAAKPIIDIDLVVADPADEPAYVPPLVAAGFVLRVREPWWWQHRMLRLDGPLCNLHVVGPDSPVPWRDRVFRDHLRRCPDDRELYARAKREASRAALAAGEHGMQYNRRKQDVVREIHHRAFVAAGLLPG